MGYFQAGSSPLWFRDDQGESQYPLEIKDGIGGSCFFVGEKGEELLNWAEAGVKTIWVNSSFELISMEFPRYDFEISRIDPLESMNEINRYLSLNQCLAWWKEWNLPENIRKHLALDVILIQREDCF